MIEAGGIDVFLTKDKSGFFEVWGTWDCPCWISAYNRWDGSSRLFHVDDPSDFLPKELLEQKGGPGDWPVEATLCLNLK